MAVQNPPPVRPSFGRRLWLAFVKLVKFVFKLFFIVLILAAIAAAIYFGAPVLIEEYLLKDVNENRSMIQEIDQEMGQNSELFGERLSDFQDRLDRLEVQSDTDKQTIADLQTELAIAQEQLAEQATTLDSVDNFQALLTEHEETLTEFETQLSIQDGSLEEIRAELEATGISITANQSEMEALRAELETQDTLITLRHELELLKAMELITRARVSIGDDNIGLAQNDLELALELLSNLSTTVPAHQADILADIILRLELALGNLENLPNLASEDLEVAWQLLIPGLPMEPAQDEAAGEPTPTPTPNP
jgi:hypothetical protein